MRRAGATLLLLVGLTAHAWPYRALVPNQGKKRRAVDAAVLRWLKDGPAPAQFAAGTMPASTKGATPSQTRATAQLCLNSSGTLTSVAGGSPCIESYGLYASIAHSNDIATISRALDNASWTKAGGATVTADSTTGPDGTAGADTLDFGASPTGTAKAQHCRAASAGTAYSFGVWLKTSSGTKTVRIARWNGTSWATAVVSDPITVTTSWTRHWIAWKALTGETQNCVTVGGEERFSNAPSAGAVYADGEQLQTSITIGSTIFSGTNAVTATSVANPLSGVNPTTWCLGFEFRHLGGGAPRATEHIINIGTPFTANSATVYVTATSGFFFEVWDSAGVMKRFSSVYNYPGGAHHVHACSASGTLSVDWDGVAMQGGVATGTGTGVITTQQATIRLGDRNSTDALMGHINRVCLAADATTCRRTVTPSGIGVATIGDSLTEGYQIGRAWPTRLGELLGSSYDVRNFAWGGSLVSHAQAQYDAYVEGRGYSYVTVLAGTNNLANSASAATVWTSLQALFDDIRTDGVTLIPVTLPARYTSSTWTDPKQTELETLNTSIRNYCTTYGLTCLDAYDLTNDSVDARYLAEDFDNGDNLHFSQWGADTVAGAVKAVISP